MVETIDLKTINEKADNIYEAIISIARRARQINDDQRIFYERENEFEETTDFDDDELEKINLDDVGVNLPKPSRIALDEFMDSQFNIDYAEENVN